MKNYIFCFVTFLTCIFGSGDARADVIVNFTEVGGDVVSSAEGSIDVVGLDFSGGGIPIGAQVDPDNILAVVGPSESNTQNDAYADPTVFSSNSTAFGNGNAPLTFADVGSGGPFGFITGQQGSLLFLPVDYLSGSAITAESTYNDVDLPGLGIVPGTYVYSVGSNTITLNAVAAIPEPTHASCLSLMLFSLLCHRRKS